MVVQPTDEDISSTRVFCLEHLCKIANLNVGIRKQGTFMVNLPCPSLSVCPIDMRTPILVGLLKGRF